jgi:DNA polymerase delta subunit 2
LLSIGEALFPILNKVSALLVGDFFMLRASTTVESLDSFRLKEKTFTQQYSGVYFTRINVLRSRFPDLWDTNFVPRLIQIKQNADCYIIGTLYIDMPLKPSILSEITREVWFA